VGSTSIRDLKNKSIYNTEIPLEIAEKSQRMGKISTNN
jgi:hypothetical protein